MLGKSEMRLSQQTLSNPSVGKASTEFRQPMNRSTSEMALQSASGVHQLPKASVAEATTSEREYLDESLLVNEQYPGDPSHLFEINVPGHDAHVDLQLDLLSTPYTDKLLKTLNQSSDSIKDMLEKTKQLEAKTAVDAATLYRSIKQKVSKEAFDDFASAITAFNTGSKTPMQAIEEIRSILKDDDLTLQMSKLICNAYQ
jgi:hypothetical protein